MRPFLEFVINKPRTVLIIIAAITCIMALGIPKLDFDNSIETMMPKKDKDYIYDKKVRKIYGNVGKFLIFNITSKNIWTYEFFKAIDDIGKDLEEFKNYDSEKEKERIDKLITFKDKQIKIEKILNAFRDDPSFQRQLHRLMGMNPATRQTVSAEYKAINSKLTLSKMKLKILISQCKSLEKIKAKKIIDEILSPITVQDISGKNNTLKTVDLIKEDNDGIRLIPKTKKEFQLYKKLLLKNPTYKKALYTGIENNDNTFRITDFALMISLKDVDNIEEISTVAWEISKYYPQLNPTLQGIPIVYKFMTDYMKRDLVVFLPLVFLVMIIILFLNFKSPRGVILPCLVLITGDIWLMGLMGHLGLKLTVIGISLPVLMVAVGSSYTIHILNQYYIDYDEISLKGKQRGLIDSLSHITVTVLLAGITTFFGFMSLLSSEIGAMADWGIFSAIGVIMAVLLSITLVPASLVLLKHKDRNEGKNLLIFKKSWVDPVVKLFSKAAIHHNKGVILCTIIILVMAIIGITRINVETAFMTFFKKDSYVRKSSKLIGKKFGGSSGMSIVINSGKKDGIKEVDFLKTIEKFRDWLEEEKNKDLNIGRTEAFIDLIKSMHMAMNNDERTFFKIPKKRSDIWDYLEIFSGKDENDDGRVDIYESYVDADFQEVMIFARLWGKNGRVLGSNDMLRIENKILKHLKKTMPQKYTYRISGESRNIINLSNYVTQGQMVSLFFSLLAVCILVIMLFKNFKAGIISLIPMSSAILINFGLMGWLGINLDLATALIASVTIGIGVDDTIHFLNTFRHYKHQGFSTDETIIKTLSISGKAICYTSLALIFGFLVMASSNFRPVMLLGILFGVTMIATTIGALLILPAVIKLTEVNLDQSTSDSFFWKIFHIGRFFKIEK